MSSMEPGTDISSLLGTVVAKRFRIESLIGAGAMGVVFRATMVGDARRTDPGTPPVALKIVLPDAKQQRTVPRILRGAKLAAQVKHPHVVETLAHGRLGRETDKDGGGYYVAMELVDGVALGRLGTVDLPVGALVTLMRQVLDALANMHARGILHRDIKPDNILVARQADGQLVAKISDFGIAADTQTDATSLTQPGTLIGTPMYMAPEQMQGRGRDTPALDLYPIGVMLYELVSGKLPFSGHSLAALMAKLSEDPPPVAARDGVELPEGLGAVIMRLLARDPLERYAFAADARKALAPFATPATIAAERWREIVEWDRRHRADQELPAGWSGGITALAGGTAEPPVSVREVADLPVIGRDDVLAGVGAMAAEVEAGEVRAAVLRSGVGMGKSALLGEVMVRLGACGRFQPVRTGYNASSSTCEALRQAIECAFGTAGLGLAQLRYAVSDHLRRAGEDDEAEARALLAFLRPTASESLTQPEMFALVHRSLRRLARSRPVLLTIDDFAHGGADAAAFLEFLLFQGAYEPFPLLIVVAVCSDHQSEGFRAIFERSARFEGTVRRTFELQPLDHELLARALVSHLQLGHTQARRIARRAAGNPLYAVLMARAEGPGRTGGSGETAMDEATVTMQGNAATPRSDAGPGSAAGNGAGSDTGERVPRALREILELDLRNQLERSGRPERVRSLLEAVAILGAAVDVSLLEAFLADDESRHQLDDDLDRCIDLGILEWSQQGSAEVVSFSPAVMRDVVLAGLNPRRARRLHGRAIDVRQVWAGADVDVEAGALGDHCEAVGRLDEAIDWWLRGQRYEREGGDSLLGVEWGRKALAAMKPGDRRQGSCAIALGRTLLDAGELEQATDVLVPVVGGADADLAMQAGDVLCDVFENCGNEPAWTALIQQMSAREAEATDAGRTYLYIARAMWNSYHGSREDGMRDAERALAQAGPGEPAQRAAQRMAFLYMFRGELERADSMARRALAESGNRSDLRVRSLRTLGIMLGCTGRHEEALALHREALDICRRAGFTARIPLALIDVGDCKSLLGDYAQALQCYREAEHAANELGMRSVKETVLFRYLVVDLDQGRTEGIHERIHVTLQQVKELDTVVEPYFYDLLSAWAHAIDGEVRQCLDFLARIGSLERFPVHTRFSLTIGSLIDHLGRAAATQPLSAQDRADAVRWLDGAATFLRRLPGTGLVERCAEVRERFAAAA
jgi:tetratricopeptide (TPR) repeat protein